MGDVRRKGRTAVVIAGIERGKSGRKGTRRKSIRIRGLEHPDKGERGGGESVRIAVRRGRRGPQLTTKGWKRWNNSKAVYGVCSQSSGCVKSTSGTERKTWGSGPSLIRIVFKHEKEERPTNLVIKRSVGARRHNPIQEKITDTKDPICGYSKLLQKLEGGELLASTAHCSTRVVTRAECQ